MMQDFNRYSLLVDLQTMKVTMHEAWMKVRVREMPWAKMKLGRRIYTIYKVFVSCHSFPSGCEILQFRFCNIGGNLF